MELFQLAAVASWSQILSSLWLDYVWPILMLVFGLGLVIFIHEFGHFAVAKMVGIRVERFALGFGPRVIGILWGETDYCLNLLPLGGYVKMLGQEDFKPLEENEKPDPRAYNNKSVGARFAVISAGVIMNVILAAVLFVIVCLAGIQFKAPIVGGVVPGKPAAEANIQWQDNTPGLPQTTKGLQAGDRILQIDGSEVTKFEKLYVTAALSSSDSKHELMIERQVDGHKRIGTTWLGVVKSPLPSGGQILAFGIESPADNVLGKGKNDLAPGPFHDDDEVVAIAGKPVVNYWDIEPITKTLSGEPVVVTVIRGHSAGKPGQRLDLHVQPTIRTKPAGVFLKDGTILRGTLVDDATQDKTPPRNARSLTIIPAGSDKEQTLAKGEVVGLTNDELLDVLGMIPRLRVTTVWGGMPAEEAGVLPDDIVLSYGDRNSPTYRQFMEVNKAVANTQTTLVVLRDGKSLTLKVAPKVRDGVPIIGVAQGPDMAHLNLAGIRQDSPAAKAGLLSGDILRTVNGQPVQTWSDLVLALQKADDKEVVIGYTRGEQQHEAKLGKLANNLFSRDDYGLLLFEGFSFRVLLGPEVRKNPVDALVWGVKETGDFILQTYLTLRSLIQRDVSTKEVMGPVGMASVAIDVGRESIVRMIYFMAMISVSLAVINFLPFPVVDGGHAVFLLIEKIRGKPMPIKLMNIIQVFGIVVLLSVFVLVTWQDIMRLVK